MRVSLAAALVCFVLNDAASGFAPPVVDKRLGLLTVNMAQDRSKKLTSQDIINRARQAVGIPEVEEAPKIFEDDLLDDMQQSLLKLEKRVKEGPGSLSSEEVLQFELATKRVLVEMKQKLAAKQSEAPQRSSTASTAGSPLASQSTSPSESSTGAATTASPPPKPGYGITDMSNDEGPAYDGTGGMGVARGTRNTYVIPGMDEMSPEEYRAALQKSVSDRQSRRKEGYGGVVGNRAAHQYLEQLGWGGASSNLSGKDAGDGTEPANVAPPAVVPAPAPVSHVHHPVPAFYEQVKISEAHKVVDRVVQPTGIDAKGYVIPGIEQMSREEYRAALQKPEQKSVSNPNRQTRRKGGDVRNRAAHHYFDDNWKPEEKQ